MLQKESVQHLELAQADWREVISRLIKSEMSKRKIKYDDLSRQLKVLGTKQSAANLRNKINRGIMGADLFIQLVMVLNISLSPELMEELIATLVPSDLIITESESSSNKCL